jgi:sporulation protein YlmC with PRC-barrel domain/osmotically-inducible protein OsmY
MKKRKIILTGTALTAAALYLAPVSAHAQATQGDRQPEVASEAVERSHTGDVGTTATHPQGTGSTLGQTGPGRPASPVDRTGRPLDRGESPGRITAPEPTGQAMQDRSRPMTDADGGPTTGVALQQQTRSASDIIGKDIRGAEGDSLGQVRDLVVDTETGEITFAIVRSGGVLGIGGTRRAVPYPALNPGPQDDHLIIDIDEARWESAPEFREDQLATLTRENRGERIYQHFGQTWAGAGAEVSAGIQTQAGAAPAEVASAGDHLMLASQLQGLEIRSGEQVVGQVEDVIVQPDRQTAALRVEVDGDIAAADTSYLLGFDQVSLQEQDGDRVIHTQLSPHQFGGQAQAGLAGNEGGDTVAFRGGADVESGVAGSVYTSGGGVQGGPATVGVQTQDTQSAQPAMNEEPRVRFADATANPQNRPQSPVTGSAPGGAMGATTPATTRSVDQQTGADASVAIARSERASAQQVEQALRDDPQLEDVVQDVRVSERGETIVLSGNIEDEDDRERVVARARAAAGGREVEDDLEGGRVAE